jgi:hypothetical protein
LLSSLASLLNIKKRKRKDDSKFSEVYALVARKFWGSKLKKPKD